MNKKMKIKYKNLINRILVKKRKLIIRKTILLQIFQKTKNINNIYYNNSRSNSNLQEIQMKKNKKHHTHNNLKMLILLGIQDTLQIDKIKQKSSNKIKFLLLNIKIKIFNKNIRSQIIIYLMRKSYRIIETHLKRKI